MQQRLNEIGSAVDQRVLAPGYIDDFRRLVFDPEPLFMSNAVLQTLNPLPQEARRLRPALSASIVPQPRVEPQSEPEVYPHHLLCFISAVASVVVICAFLLQIPLEERFCFFFLECHVSNTTRPIFE